MEMISKLTTEMRNEKSKNLDQMTIDEILELMNEEDKMVPDAVKAVLPEIGQAVAYVKEALLNGGSVFYIGAGTSGRIGLLDAVECPPTFSTSADKVQAVLAGGEASLFKAIEGAEDNQNQGVKDLEVRKVSKRDVVIGIAASGRTPYVKGALEYASFIGAKVVSLTSNKHSEISKYADVAIEVVTGPEVLTGSTRLKAATAHKMILNMISTASMIKFGKVYQNLMVDVNASNYKLKERAKMIVSEATGVPYSEAEHVLEETNYEVKPAIVKILTGTDPETAKSKLIQANGFVREAVNSN
ncbi:N-acetylmuramic acid-6-phosphate etherase [Jeotgalibacillus alimentarius]|uniref:N-acetylmuramic acid 6-phosphate etherase n=1 Tax=Jeotgalibacillus alimentarius TaxID=135826 RepID=A0A0C2QZG3_9BACL|nr:N-acetylmuramic acid 6-phosphate etherase [Jeotgalibacillus alimentarius]KIL43450.1 N-acetylmuramic acid-6-phosphate etherase [Jeotgalibacillus alimentarius]